MGCGCGGSTQRQQVQAARSRQHEVAQPNEPRGVGLEGIYWTGPERAPQAPAAPVEKPA